MVPLRFLPSPHADFRPEGVKIDMVVVHAISLPPGYFASCYVDDLFMGRLDPCAHPLFPEIAALAVSAHFWVGRSGEVTQYVPVARRAWHAGQSWWLDRSRCNDFSVGVELAGDQQTPFEPVQYVRLAELIRTIQERHPEITDARVVGHQNIAPDRKWDPGPMFDWPRLHALLHKTAPVLAWPLVWE